MKPGGAVIEKCRVEESKVDRVPGGRKFPKVLLQIYWSFGPGLNFQFCRLLCNGSFNSVGGPVVSDSAGRV
jgi:hypothetical protein